MYFHTFSCSHEDEKEFLCDPFVFILPHETRGFKSNLPTLKSVMNFQELATPLASTEVLSEQRCDAAQQQNK